ncbi:hypothetical protein [Stenotrophomonas sp. NY11291]|uniref:hypothetical protein n=1 Tax=Stenotrophomonas sp. NY11291 TaxID=2939415 RepID=UPI002010214E|nr:hypothetical protein [Stenotrophomonas sp. NY11291]UQA20934.1 hypothetical protein M1L61_14215 [Stenotrophomonas sp. NY11291]
MAIEFCPLADEVGNLADWFAVGIGAVAAVSTTVVAFLAYRTSDRAAGIAEEAKRIAQQQHGEAVKLREENARIIGRLLLYEVTALPVRMGVMVKDLDTGIDVHARRIRDGGAMCRALDEAERALLPGAERVEDRIHNLPDSIGADLATLIGGSRTLGDLVRKIRERVIKPTGVNPTWRYGADYADFQFLLGQLEWLRGISEQFAAEFREFVGVPAEEQIGPANPEATP